MTSEQQVSVRSVRRLIKVGTSALKATRWKRVVAFADRIEAWSEAATRRRFIVTLIALVALIVAVRPLVSVLTDLAIVTNERFLGWGYCFERDPGTKGFDARRNRRSCIPDHISLFTWQDGPRREGCLDCDSNAAQLVVASEGQQLWVEYYFKKDRWLPAHHWKLVHPRLVAVDHREGVVLQRVDHGIRVCSTAFHPLTLEFFVPLDAGRGCDAPSLWGYTTPLARLDRLLDRVLRKHECSPVTNTLYLRWLQDPIPNRAACSDDLTNPYLFLPVDRMPKAWKSVSRVSIIRRD